MTEDPPAVGTTVHCEVDLGTTRLDSKVMIRAKGRVSRVEMTDLVGRLGGFAISIRRMRLEKSELPPE